LAMGGRPKEEGGHKPVNLSLKKSIRKKLGRIPDKSQLVEALTENFFEEAERASAISDKEAMDFWLRNVEVAVSDSAAAVLGSGSPCFKFRVRDRFPEFQDYLNWLKTQA
jgi:hypothetical protein